MEKIRHIMVDLETLGVSHNAIFLSVAMVSFDEDTIHNRFRKNITLESAMRSGGGIDASTIKWWMDQRPEIMARMFVDAEYLNLVLLEAKVFIQEEGDCFMWGNSASFDLGLLKDAYERLQIAPPWNYHQEMCYRTMRAQFKSLCSHIPYPEDAHDPIIDCEYQIACLQAIMNKNKIALEAYEKNNGSNKT